MFHIQVDSCQILQMWMEGVAIALPRVQDHFDISGGKIGWLSSFFFCGMMFGAVGWGNCELCTIRVVLLWTEHDY